MSHKKRGFEIISRLHNQKKSNHKFYYKLIHSYSGSTNLEEEVQRENEIKATLYYNVRSSKLPGGRANFQSDS
jgi:hypothetical protein